MRLLSFKIAIVSGAVGVCVLVVLMWRLIDTYATKLDEPLFTEKRHEGRTRVPTNCIQDDYGWWIHFDYRCNIVVLLDGSADKSDWPHPESTARTAIFLDKTPFPFAICDSRDKLYVYSSDRVLHAFAYTGDTKDTFRILHSKFITDRPAEPAKLSLREEMANLCMDGDMLLINRFLLSSK